MPGDRLGLPDGLPEALRNLSLLMAGVVASFLPVHSFKQAGLGKRSADLDLRDALHQRAQRDARLHHILLRCTLASGADLASEGTVAGGYAGIGRPLEERMSRWTLSSE